MSIFNDLIDLTDIDCNEWNNYIGNGYRSVFYTHDELKNGRIILMGYDKEDNPKNFIVDWKPHVKYVVKYETEEKDMYGRFVETQYFKNVFMRKKFIEDNKGTVIVEALRPEQEFLQFMFSDIVLDDGFNGQDMRIHYIDIETEISDQFESPTTARNRINMITVFDTLTQKFYTWSLWETKVDFKEEPLCNMDKNKFVLKCFNDNEEELLIDFIKWMENNYPTTISGWNVKHFDVAYIVRRIENVLNGDFASRLSPVLKYRIREENLDNERVARDAEISVDIEGIFIADGLLLYRDKFKIKQALPSYSLNAIGEEEGLGKKIEYSGSLKDLYLKEYDKFYEYNVRDVDLCMRIIEKTKLIQFARQITTFGLCDYNTIYTSISYLIGNLISFAKHEFGYVFCSYLPEKHNFDRFEGAFVFPPNVAVYQNFIAVLDFASLYPSTIRCFNASPETYVGKIIIYRKNELGDISCNTIDDEPFNVYDDEVAFHPSIYKIELMTVKGARKAITVEQLRELIKTKCIYTTNNTLFLKHSIKQGVVAKWSEHFYNMRKLNKKKCGEYLKKLRGDLTGISEDEISEWKLMADRYDAFQYALKIMLNSVYGLLGTTFSCIANPHIAQSITRGGKFFNVETSKFIKKMFIERYGAKEEYVTPVYGDTDSIFSEGKIQIKTTKNVQK